MGRVKLSQPLQFSATASNKMMEKYRMAATGIDGKRRGDEAIFEDFFMLPVGTLSGRHLNAS